MAFFHFPVEGSCKVRLADGGDSFEAAAGDLVLFPREGKHLMGTDLHLAPMESDAMAASHSATDADLVHLLYGGGGAATRFVCGYLACSRSVCRPSST